MWMPKWLIKKIIRDMIKTGGTELVLDWYARVADKYSVKAGCKYANAEEEVNDVISSIPELEPIKSSLLTLCRNNRKRVGLPV